MMKQACCILLCLCASYCHAGPLSSQQLDGPKGIKAVVSGYKYNLMGICNCKSLNNATRYWMALHELYVTDGFTKTTCVADLPRLKTTVGLHPCDYVNLLNEQYQFSVKTTISNEVPYECTDTLDGHLMVYVSFDKTIIYNEETTTFTEVLALTETDPNVFKIHEVFYPEDYIKQGNCKIADALLQRNILFNQWFREGDTLFTQKDYINAKLAYKLAYKYREDESVRDKILQCTRQADLNTIKDKADDYASKGNYNAAIVLYKELSDSFPAERQFAQKHMSECRDLDRYNKFKQYVTVADDLYARQFFQKARQAYESALAFNSADTYVLSQIKECKSHDPQVIREKIKTATVLSGKKDMAPEAFSILYELEPSGLLTGENYYFMAKFMNGSDADVTKNLGFNKDEAHNLVITYYKKAVEMGCGKALKIQSETAKAEKVGSKINLVPLTANFKNSLPFSDIDWERVQFYISGDLVLTKTRENTDIKNGSIRVQNTSDQILIKSGTPCVLIKMPKSDKMLIAFNTNNDNFLSFGVNPKFDNKFTILASDWSNGIGKVHYNGSIYELSERSRGVYLLVDCDHDNSSKYHKHSAKGMRVR